jgi:hypothetical protein
MKEFPFLRRVSGEETKFSGTWEFSPHYSKSMETELQSLDFLVIDEAER